MTFETFAASGIRVWSPKRSAITMSEASYFILVVCCFFSRNEVSATCEKMFVKCRSVAGAW